MSATRPRRQLGDREAHQRAERGVGVEEAPAGVEPRDRVGRAVGRELREPQELLGLALRGDVVVDAEHADHRAGRVAQRHLRRAQPDRASVGGGLGLLVGEPRHARLHDLAVVGAVQLGLFAPA
jgi:hypothetical protein